MPVFFGTELWGPKPVASFSQASGGILYWLLEKQGKLYFLQSSQTKGRDVLASKKPSLVQLPCAKTREFGEAEFSDCLPVSALVCVFAFDTGGLGLWGGQGFIGAKASLDPLCRFFVTQSSSQ